MNNRICHKNSLTIRFNFSSDIILIESDLSLLKLLLCLMDSVRKIADFL